MPKIKKGENIFNTPELLKTWALELSDACGSLLVSKKPNVSKVDALIDKFVTDYNNNVEEQEEK